MSSSSDQEEVESESSNAAVEAGSADALELQPDYAAICSFLNRFGTMLTLKPMHFVKLRDLLMKPAESDEQIDRELVDLHVKLMRFVGFASVSPGKWTTFLMKV